MKSRANIRAKLLDDNGELSEKYIGLASSVYFDYNPNIGHKILTTHLPCDLSYSEIIDIIHHPGYSSTIGVQELEVYVKEIKS